MRNGYRHYGAGSGAQDMVMTHDARTVNPITKVSTRFLNGTALYNNNKDDMTSSSYNRFLSSFLQLSLRK